MEDLEESFRALCIPKAHVTVGLSNLIASNKAFRSLFVNRRLPDDGWTEFDIQHFLFMLSTLDTNNKTPVQNASSQSTDGSRWCGVGEREGRVYSNLVAQRHFGLGHGIGRSGDITEPQPKALGSSVLAKLTLILVLDLVRRGSGLDRRTVAAHGVLLPMCTGMTMALVLSSLRQSVDGVDTSSRDVVLWSRIDQKSVLKSIQTAGLQCIVIPTKLEGDAVSTDMDALRAGLDKYGKRVLAVVTTSSCFAPREPDAVDKVAALCKEHDVCHVINHAYGLQSAKTNKLLNRACVIGRVDAVVSSLDKNFLVPVGGALVLSPNESVVKNIGKTYAGRASSSPHVDLFITLLSMGINGYKTLLEQRQTILQTFPQRLSQVVEKHGERLLHCQQNDISFGITLDGLCGNDNSDITALGAMLFSRCVSGTRVVPKATDKKVCGILFRGFGSSVDDYPHSYLTAACALGLQDEEVTLFTRRLDKTLSDFKKKQKKK
jgi:O-phospho-L-seryl-tRNASec:L-selenocysteinyl-tRNA synthase